MKFHDHTQTQTHEENPLNSQPLIPRPTTHKKKKGIFLGSLDFLHLYFRVSSGDFTLKKNIYIYTHNINSVHIRVCIILILSLKESQTSCRYFVVDLIPQSESLFTFPIFRLYLRWWSLLKSSWCLSFVSDFFFSAVFFQKFDGFSFWVVLDWI